MCLLYTPTKRPNAQHLVEYEKQLLYEENQNSGNVMQQPMDSYVCCMNSSSESILIRSYLLFARLKRSCRIPVNIFYAKSKSDKTRELDFSFVEYFLNIQLDVEHVQIVW